MKMVATVVVVVEGREGAEQFWMLGETGEAESIFPEVEESKLSAHHSGNEYIFKIMHQ